MVAFRLLKPIPVWVKRCGRATAAQEARVLQYGTSKPVGGGVSGYPGGTVAATGIPAMPLTVVVQWSALHRLL